MKKHLLPNRTFKKHASATSAPQSDEQDRLMGAQMTAKFREYVTTQRAGLILGVMGIRVREQIMKNRAEHRGRNSTGNGLKGWLANYAPDITPSVIYRLIEVVEGLLHNLKIGKQVDLQKLLLAEASLLPKNLAAHRAKIEKAIEGKSQRQLLLQYGNSSHGDGRTKNPGGFRPNWEKLRDWLMEKYPDRIELLDVELFSDFPPDIQARFKKEGPRYKCRLTKEQRETIEKARRAQNWCAAAVPALHGAIDDAPYVVADDDLLMQIETALKDLLNGVQMHRRSRKGKLSLN